MTETWVEQLDELLSTLEERPDDASPAEERLEWHAAEVLGRLSRAGNLRAPIGVRRAEYESWPRVLCDKTVVRWMTQKQVAEAFGVDPRTVQRWESKGLPHFGHAKSKRYPLPHAVVWGLEYSMMKAAGLRVPHLPIDIALAQQHLAEVVAQTSYRGPLR